jgi:hypothetical protein
MTDQTGSAHMTQGSLTTFVPDRFGNQNSALNLNGGWTQVPAGNYFNTPEFAISVWVYPQQAGVWARVIDFGNGQTEDNVILSFKFGNDLTPAFQVISGNTILFETVSTQSIVFNAWQFLTATFDGINSRIYINGTLANTVVLSSPFSMSNTTRINCYIGKSSWSVDGVSYSYIDSLRFYNISLTQSRSLSS